MVFGARGDGQFTRLEDRKEGDSESTNGNLDVNFWNFVFKKPYVAIVA